MWWFLCNSLLIFTITSVLCETLKFSKDFRDYSVSGRSQISRNPSRVSRITTSRAKLYDSNSNDGNKITNIHTKQYECGCQEVVREYVTTITDGCGKEECPCGCAGGDVDPEVLFCPDQKPCDCDFECDCEETWGVKMQPSNAPSELYCPDEKDCDCPFACNCAEEWKKVELVPERHGSCHCASRQDIGCHCDEKEPGICAKIFCCKCGSKKKKKKPKPKKEPPTPTPPPTPRSIRCRTHEN